MPHAVLGFRAITSLRLQRILASRLLAFGWRVTFLFVDEGRGDLVQRARQEIDGLAPVVAIDAFSDAGSASLAIAKTHPSPLRAFAARLWPSLSRAHELAIYRTLHQRMIARSIAALQQFGASLLVVTEDGMSSNFRLLAVARPSESERQYGTTTTLMPSCFAAAIIQMSTAMPSSPSTIASGRYRFRIRYASNKRKK